MEYQVKKTLLGKQVVRYCCTKCDTALESPLADAGNRDTCPVCAIVYEIPGSSKSLVSESLISEQKMQVKDKLSPQEERQEREREAYLRANPWVVQPEQERRKSLSPLAKKWVNALIFGGIATLVIIPLELYLLRSAPKEPITPTVQRVETDTEKHERRADETRYRERLEREQAKAYLKQMNDEDEAAYRRYKATHP